MCVVSSMKAAILKRHSITNKHCKRIIELVKAGAFDNKSGCSGDRPTAVRTTGRRKPTHKK